MAWIPDNTTLNQLKCCACKSYLSVGPVTQTPVGYDCGRCLDTGSEPITIFEFSQKTAYFHVDSMAMDVLLNWHLAKE